MPYNWLSKSNPLCETLRRSYKFELFLEKTVMNRSNLELKNILALLFFAILSTAANAECQMTNEDLDSMAPISITLSKLNGDELVIEGLLANNSRTRAAGFQYVCSERVASTAILFEFQRPTKPSFHMNNVQAPLDIAFINKRGRVDSFHQMKTYPLMAVSKPTYSSKGTIIAALEVREGFFADNNIDPNASISWRPVDRPVKLEGK